MIALRDTVQRILAQHREAGTPEAERARDAVRSHLTGLGYHVSVQRFRFHPSALLGLPLLGAGVGASALLALPLLVLPGVPAAGALAVWGLILAASVCLAAGVGAGWLTLGESREDANLIAVKSPEPVRRWIVAHLDTKAQAQSMAGRLVAVWVLAAAIVVGGGSAVARLWGPLPLWLATLAAAVAVLAGALAGRGRLRGTSRGARDNGSGVVAALAFAEAAAKVPAEAASAGATGILVTGAEEFGLVGARMFARIQGSLNGVEVVNLDTIDGEGDLFVVSHDRRGAAAAGRLAERLGPVGLPVRTRRLPIGILVDSLPLARTGAVAVTIGRLTWRTLRVIHTPADVPETLSLDAAERVGRALATN
ncbi:MAG TPA: M28 family peptidase [Gemmatimonadales bacterium]|nr:M28 family peptidase [Gemmatimonadales bacterium]